MVGTQTWIIVMLKILPGEREKAVNFSILIIVSLMNFVRATISSAIGKERQLENAAMIPSQALAKW